MSEEYLAYAILFFAYVFVAPFLLLIISDISPTGDFKKDYALAFKGFHLLFGVAALIVFVVFLIIWAFVIITK